MKPPEVDIDLTNNDDDDGVVHRFQTFYTNLFLLLHKAV